MTAWHITDWEQYYEVNSDGGRWRSGQKKRAKPPEYIRWYVGGPGGDDRAYQECSLGVADKFGPEAWAVAFGLFGKLLEVAATQDTQFRGYILGKNHSPISISPAPIVMLCAPARASNSCEELPEGTGSASATTSARASFRTCQ